ncbi:MAG: multicopper oxidase domain-containing protein [Nitrospirae bacterium]|nr:multicopper oxidase domain-containing protein [Nitrospirota bacterium]
MTQLILGFGILALVVLIANPVFAVEGQPVGPGFQCPNDLDNFPTGNFPGPEDNDRNGNGIFDADPNVVCKRLGATDGYVRMPDGTNHYTFGFVDLTGVPGDQAVDHKFNAHLPAPTIEVNQGQVLYLSVINLGLAYRPDLDDSHTIHYHGFPHAMAIFDGVPENSIAVRPASEFTYFYKINDPGTYPYHCHFEPVEHIQLGMVGIIVVHPAQDGVDGPGDTLTGTYAYNDAGVPDTGYDVAVNLLINELDGRKHWNMENIQEGTTLWHTYFPHYSTLNGRSYPETLLTGNDPALNVTPPDPTADKTYIPQDQSSLIEANVGQRILLRLVNLGYKPHTLTIPGIPMHVVGEDAKLLKGPGGTDVSYMRTTFGIEGGKTADILLNTAGLTAGTYFLYGRELNSQSGIDWRAYEAGAQSENRNGMITEIRLY